LKNNLLQVFQNKSYFRLSRFTRCRHNHQGLVTRNLKIHAYFSSHETIKRKADVEDLEIFFSPSNHIFAGIGETFTSLKKLQIVLQEIKFVERVDFINLAQLEELYISYNQIEFLHEDVFQDLPNLHYLSLSQNKIQKLPEKILKNLTKLKEINFNSNRIEYLPKDLFADNLQLEKIYAWQNPLKTIDVDFTKLPRLGLLWLRDANCIDFNANNQSEVQETQQIVNHNCTKQIK
jgi:Leucine-rich repeat (LRR) protein